MAEFRPGQSPPPVTRAIFFSEAKTLSLWLVLDREGFHGGEKTDRAVVDVNDGVGPQLLSPFDQSLQRAVISPGPRLHQTEVVEVLRHGPASPNDFGSFRLADVGNRRGLGRLDDLGGGAAAQKDGQ